MLKVLSTWGGGTRGNASGRAAADLEMSWPLTPGWEAGRVLRGPRWALPPAALLQPGDCLWRETSYRPTLQMGTWEEARWRLRLGKARGPHGVAPRGLSDLCRPRTPAHQGEKGLLTSPLVEERQKDFQVQNASKP